VEALAPGLKDHEPQVRVAAAWALGQIGSTRAREPLEAALHDASPEVQAAAQWASTSSTATARGPEPGRGCG
jgi:HEAT repeat protein